MGGYFGGLSTLQHDGRHCDNDVDVNDDDDDVAVPQSMHRSFRHERRPLISAYSCGQSSAWAAGRDG